MFTTYRTRTGDTFERVSRTIFGDESRTVEIAALNASVNPTVAGQLLTVPARTSRRGASQLNNDLEVLIDGVPFIYWTSATLTRNIAAPSTLHLTAPFEPENAELRRFYRPLAFPSVDVFIGGERVFSGFMLSPIPDSTVTGTTISASCYSKCAVLGDCMPPTSVEPISYTDTQFESIATQLAQPFGVRVINEAPGTGVFKRVKCDVTQPVLEFLVGLAKQRSRILTDNSDGDLVIRSVTDTGDPVARLVGGRAPLKQTLVTFPNQQKFYSHVTAYESARPGRRGQSATVVNPALKAPLRPYNFTVADGQGDAETAARATLARMQAGAVSYEVSLPTVRDELGRLFRDNTTLTLHDPSAMIYQPYEFVISKAVYEFTPNSEVCGLSLVLPGAYTGEIPTSLPWDE